MSTLSLLNRDCLSLILNHLEPQPFVALSLCCRGLERRCHWWLSVRMGMKNLTRFTFRKRVMDTGTCPCGRIGWSLHQGEVCWYRCDKCDRMADGKLFVFTEGRTCRFGCVPACEICKTQATIKNVHTYYLYIWQDGNGTQCVCENCYAKCGYWNVLKKATPGLLAGYVLHSRPAFITIRGIIEISDDMRMEEYLLILRALLAAYDPRNPIIGLLGALEKVQK